MWYRQAAAVTLLLLCAALPDALASKPRCKLERIDPSLLGEGRLRLYASALELEGDIIDDLAPAAFTLLVNGKPRGKPEKMVRFSDANEQVKIAVLVEAAAQYKQALPDVKAALKEFLEDQPRSIKINLLPFGSDVGTPVRPFFLPADQIADAVDELEPDIDSGDVQMAQTVRNAMGQLQRPDPGRAATPPKGAAATLPPRRLVVLISDGLNDRMDRQTFKDLGEFAARERIPIHTIAYSPIDSRGPLLNLGDLSKRSGGTFRWAENAADIKHELSTLADEVRRQYVLTFKTELDASSIEKYNFGLVCGELRSNSLSGTGARLLHAPGGDGLRWYWWVLIGVGGALAALYLVGLLLLRRGRVAQPGATPPTAAAGGQGLPFSHAPAARATAPVATTPSHAPPAHTPARAPAPAARAPGAASGVLIAVTGPLAGHRYPVTERLTVGRGSHNTVDTGEDPSVSSQHCEVRREGGALVLLDLGSSAGTWVNGRRLAAPHRLADNDLVRVGENTQFKFRID